MPDPGAPIASQLHSEAGTDKGQLSPLRKDYPAGYGAIIDSRVKAFLTQRLWTPIGLSTVDQSAPYYRHDGHWEGAGWIGSPGLSPRLGG